MSAGYAVAVRGLKKTYEETDVLDVELLELERGVAHSIVGPNGAGKSTLLRIIAGTLEPSCGRVDIQCSSVGYLPQHPYVFGFSVFKNVAIALEGAGLSQERVQDKVEQALEAVGMADMAGARGSSLSGGESQRVALARLLAASHDLLVLDEPTSAMDVRGTIAAEHALRDYAQRNDTTIIVSTHAPSQAMRMTSNMVVLVDGQVAEIGLTDRILHSPEDERVREFLSYWRL